MKDLLFNILYCLGLALIVVLIFSFIRLAYLVVMKLVQEDCPHRMREMTDKVGSPIKCMDCGKVLD